MIIEVKKRSINEIEDLDIWVSTARQVSTYDGSLSLVRRDGDNSETDILRNPSQEFINNSSPVSSGGDLETWLGSDNLFNKQWYDQSGNGNHLIQTTTIRQPEIQLNGSGNISSHIFNQSKIEKTLTSFASPITFFLVLSISSDTEGNTSPLTLKGNVTKGISLRAADNTLQVVHRDNSSIFGSSNIGILTLNQKYIISVSSNNIDNVKAWLDGINTVDKFFSNGITCNVETYKLGEYLTISLFFPGEICEFLLFKKELPDSDRQLIENYLKKIYNII